MRFQHCSPEAKAHEVPARIIVSGFGFVFECTDDTMEEYVKDKPLLKQVHDWIPAPPSDIMSPYFQMHRQLCFISPLDYDCIHQCCVVYCNL